MICITINCTTMKKNVYTLLSIFVLIGIVSCSSNKTISLTDYNKSAIKGSWLKLEENGEPSTRKHIKHYTDKNFIWEMVSKSNIIEESASGSYRVEGDELYEFIESAVQYNGVLIGRAAKIKIKIEGDTLTNTTTIGMAGRNMDFTEKWVKIK